jgi:pimeloyl-ACP methyl ester carboxylesterase
MPRGQRVRRGARRFTAADALPPSRPLSVRAGDGTALHAEVFGPEDGYPIVLAHGITCAIRVWAYRIADLARDFRVIAYDHRGHGRSGGPMFTETAGEPRGMGAQADRLAGHPPAHRLAEPHGADAGDRQPTGSPAPMVSSRHIARMAPNLAQFVELPGGHCAILECPDEVNAHLRRLIDSVGEEQRATS